MEERILEHCKSRRNRAVLAETEAGQVVIKTFTEESSFQTEKEIYLLLRETELPCAEILRAEDRTLVLTRLPGKPLTEWLERQEQTGIPHWDIWEKLVDWLMAFFGHTGSVMTDVNLRNFLYDEEENVLYGLDFEECASGSLLLCGARVAAFIRSYRPEHTPLKLAISQFVLKRFAQKLGVTPEELICESQKQEALLLERRKNKN